jgi:hypothetical protein
LRITCSCGAGGNEPKYPKYGTRWYKNIFKEPPKRLGEAAVHHCFFSSAWRRSYGDKVGIELEATFGGGYDCMMGIRRCFCLNNMLYT